MANTITTPTYPTVAYKKIPMATMQSDHMYEPNSKRIPINGMTPKAKMAAKIIINMV